jgi:hypothetical protein
MRHGTGKYIDAKNGTEYNGPWVNNQMHGLGTISSADGRVFQGEWFEGKRIYHLS